MKIIIGGGGTGGHIYPALALARYASASNQNDEILFVGTAEGLESKIVPAAGFSLTTIPARGFQRNFSKLGPSLKALGGGIREAGRILDDFKPHVVFGVGGYVSAPLMIAALKRKVPTVIHEQNALPGLANRRLAPFVRRVCISFRETEKRLPRRSRIVFTGNPRASEVAALSRAEGCRYFDLDPGHKTLLIYGGSLGALRINEVTTEYLKLGLLPPRINLIYVTGDIYYEKVQSELGELPKQVRLYPYLDRMPEALAAADIALTRSGATTLAELTALGVPALLIPSPNVVNNHQYFNARLLSDAGAAVLINESEFNSLRLQKELDKLFSNPEKLDKMRRSSRRLGVNDAVERVYKCLQEVAS